MNGWRFEWRESPGVRVDLRGVLPQTLAGVPLAEIERLPVGVGNATVPLAELFTITPTDEADTLRFAGDMARADHVGSGMTAGRIVVEGGVGHHAGTAMSGGQLEVGGDAGLHAACEMAGGTLTVAGSVGDFAACPLPGSMDGMRGGTLIVRGHAGARFGDRMRRGSAIVFGDAGDFLGSRMVAGTIALGGGAGAHPGHLMRRGSLVFAGAAPAIGATFVPAVAEAPVFWQLLSRDLARHGGPFVDLPQRPIRRWLGDLAAAGKGELIMPA
jgi:formylmethanofuran dehydrogenase subunit C